MIRPDADVTKVLAQIYRNNPAFIEWLNASLKKELDALPYCTNNIQLAQGRTQVLTELTNTLNESFQAVANPHRKP